MDLEPEHLLDERLRIKKRLGEGGFGTVYEAIDEHLNRTVAVKVLKESLMGDSSLRKRFVREGKILAAVRSDYLVRLFSLNITSDGLLYMVMELVGGKSLRQELNDKTQLNEADILQIAHGVAMALKTLDSHGVVHRDLKPDNIMLVPMEDGFEVKVLDFGLSALVNKVSVKDSYATDSGTMIGSVHYIAPELCIGERPSFQSDCYALGCLLYECVVGEPPFTSADPAAIVFRQVSEQPADPQLRVPSLGKGLRQLIIQLLQKDLSSRYQNANELLTAIDACIAGNIPEPVSGTVYSVPAHRTGKYPTAFSTSVIVLVLAALGILAFVQQTTSSISSAIPAVEVGGNHILALAEKVHSAEPSEALTYFECMRLLEKTDLPAKTRETMQAQLAQCDGRINKHTKDLIDALSQKRGGLSKAQFAAITMAAGRLGRIRHMGQTQAIIAAGLLCICEGLKSVPGDSPGLNQLNEMLGMYEYNPGPVEKSVLDSITNSVCSLAGSSQSQDKIVALELALHHAYSTRKLKPNRKLRQNFLLALNSAPIELIKQHRGTIRSAMTEAAKEGDGDVARQLAYMVLRGDKEASTGAELAQSCYTTGNDLQFVDKKAAYDFWSKSIKLYEESPQKNEYYVAALSNAASYCIHSDRSSEGRELLWRAYKNLTANFPVSDSLKLNWLHLALQFPTTADHLRIYEIATKVANRSDNTIELKNINDRIEAASIALSACRALERYTDAETLAEKCLRAAKSEHAKPELVFDLQRERVRNLVGAKNTKAIAIQEQLIANRPSARSSKEVQATLYAELAIYQEILGIKHSY